MRKLCILSTLVILISITGYSQKKIEKHTVSKAGNKEKNYKTKWKTSPFDHQVFIENKGQFDEYSKGNEKILFGAQLGNVWAYFTKNGILYRYAEILKNTESTADADPDADGPVEPVIHFATCNWEGSNLSAEIEPDAKQSYYYVYPTGTNSSINTNIYKKIIYKNIYPGIDLEYVFPKNKNGFEYSLMVDPGADLSKVKLNYPDSEELKIAKTGDIIFNSEVGEITEHAPEARYSGETGNINIRFHTVGSTESFQIEGNYDKNKTIVIDPWVTDPLFGPTYDRAYDVDYDDYGNVYTYGSWNPLQEEKFSSTGTPLWVFNASTISTNPYYGAVVVTRTSGTSYLTEGYNSSGARVMKINTLGALVATFAGISTLNEFWRAAYNPCFGNIVIGAGGTNAPNQACMLDTNLVSITPVNVLGATTAYHDMVLLATDPSGVSCYMASAHSALGQFDNMIMQLPLPSLSPTTYLVSDNFGFHEADVPRYVGAGNLTANGYDGMAVSPNWLYIYNGTTLKRLTKSTGLFNDSIKVCDTDIIARKPEWGGLAVDACDDIFVGARDSIKFYNSSLVLDTSILLSSTVYDVVFGLNNLLYACGDSFVCALNVPAPARLISTATGIPTSCSACNGTASVTINCGVSPFSFVWSNGETTQTDTGLCAGFYTVTVTDASCPPRIDTAIVNVPGEAGFTASTIDTNPNCSFSLGNITVIPNGGIPPYTYSWSNGQTTQEATGLSAGVYICTITDSTGCRYNVLVNLVNPVTPTISVVPHNDSICSGTPLLITASGAVNSFTWTPPNSGLSCYTCASPTATPTITTTYTVSGADSNGCTASATTTIKVYTTPRPVITGKDSVCSGNTDTLSVTGGTTYLWNDGSTSSSLIITVLSTQTVTVIARNGVCTHDTSFAITDVSNSARITASKDSTCSGDTITLRGSGGQGYRWSDGSTTTSIIINPTTPGTYTLYTTFGSCSDSATIHIGILKPVSATVSASPDSVCPGTNVVLTITPVGSTGTYKWNTGATTSSITVNDTVTTTYTATIYGKCDTVSYTITNKVVPLPKPVISGASLRCRGLKDTLTVSGGTSYLWSNGSTSATYITGNIDADSTIYVTAKNTLGCSATDTFKIAILNPPVVSITPIIPACTGAPVEIVAKATGTGPFTYSWSNGATTDSISVVSPPDSSSASYTVTVSNGCTTSRVATVTAQFPVLNTCCNQTLIIENDTTIISASGNSTKYFWQDSTQTICLNPPLCDSVRVTPTITTTYTVTGIDKAGCLVTGYVTITVESPCLSFTVPNVFTPNFAGPTGHDNQFYIKTENLNAWSMSIFDRWGKEVYKSSDPYKYWDGINESGSQSTDGVYYYIITGTCQSTTYKKEGFVQLIR